MALMHATCWTVTYVVVLSVVDQGGSPVSDLQQLAKVVGMEGKVHLVTCGVPSQMVELTHDLNDAMTHGHWLILQNAHLAQPWDTTLLDAVKVG